jgi:hypothetical protein
LKNEVSEITGKKIIEYVTKTEDGKPVHKISLLEDLYYHIVVNKQCGIKHYKIVLENANDANLKFTLDDLPVNSIATESHLGVQGAKDKIIITLTSGDLKELGVFSKFDDPKYNMTIYPIDKKGRFTDVKNKNSIEHRVKFQKCN